MNPKIEVVKLNIARKGHQVGTFSVKVGFDGGCEVTLPGMRIVEGSKGTFVDLPARKFKEGGFVPFYYLNKSLKDLITKEGLENYRKAGTGKQPEKAAFAVPAAARPAAASATMVSKPTVPAPAKTWPRKEWKPNSFKK